MSIVDITNEKTQLSRLVEAVENGDEVVIARDGKPAARLVRISETFPAPRRLGLLEGRYPSMSLEDFNADDAEIAALFLGEDR